MDAGTNTQYDYNIDTAQGIKSINHSMQSLIVAERQGRGLISIKTETVRFNVRTEVIRWNAERRY
jgi:hypothetical protein